MHKQQNFTTVTKHNGILTKVNKFSLRNIKPFFSKILQYPLLSLFILAFLAFIVQYVPNSFRFIRTIVSIVIILAIIAIAASSRQTRVAFFWFTILPVLSTLMVVIVLSLLIEIINWGVPKELLGVLITALATIGAVFAGSVHKSKLDIEQERLKEKIVPIYENLIDFLVEVKNRSIWRKGREKLINKIDKQIWKWSSDEVKSYWYEVQPVLLKQEVFAPEMQTKIIQLVQAIRKQADLPNEPDTQIRKLLNQSEVDTSKSVKENLAESRRRRRIDPTEFGFFDSTLLIREDRDR